MAEYLFDPTGSSIYNKVSDEILNIETNIYNDHTILVPNASPFFKSSLVVLNGDDDTPLIEGVDYAVANKFASASFSTNKAIYGSILILNSSLAGTIKITYQTLGGMWTLSYDDIVTLLRNNTKDPRELTLESVVQIPAKFPVIDHDWNMTDLVGIENIIGVIQNLLVAKLEGEGNSLHPYKLNNPHNITKQNIGLNKVVNYRVASRQETRDGVRNAYLTPAAVHYLLNEVLFGLDGKTSDEVLLEIQNLGIDIDNYDPPSLEYTNDLEEIERLASIGKMVTPKLLKLYVIKKILQETVRYNDHFEDYYGNMATDIWIKGVFNSLKYTSLYEPGILPDRTRWITAKWFYDALNKRKATLQDVLNLEDNKLVTPKGLAGYLGQLNIDGLNNAKLNEINSFLDDRLRPPIYRSVNGKSIKLTPTAPAGWYSYMGVDYLAVADSAHLVSIVNLFKNTAGVDVTKSVSYGGTTKVITLNQIVTSKVTDMSSLFRDASVFNQDMSSWDTDQVVDMQHMFNGAVVFNQDLSGWSTRNVTNMLSMFANANVFNGDVTTWDTGKVTNMTATFQGASVFNQDISNWDVEQVATFNSFRSSSGLSLEHTPPKFR